MSEDFRQNWSAYTPAEHAIWRTLFHRQEAVLEGGQAARVMPQRRSAKVV